MRIMTPPGRRRSSNRRGGTLLADRRGAAVVVIAGAMSAMVAFAGFGVDLARVWIVQSRLQTALDASALIAAREIGVASQSADTAAMFWSNFALTRQAQGTSYFGAIASNPVITTTDANTVTVTAHATVPTVFVAMLGTPSVSVNDSAQSQRATTGMELALVLDNTGSMKGAPIQAVRDSATQLVNIVYGSGQVDTVQNLWVSVVPFTAEVNLGPTHTAWLAPGSYQAANYANTTWMGCVLARHAGGHDADDAPPSVAPFTPFFYASTLGKYFNTQHQVVAGDDDWSTTNITEANQATLLDNTAVGPNLGCDATPVLPLTASRTTVLSVISSLVQTYRGGTFINLGLQAGWLSISPRWRGLWGSPTLPQDYNTSGMRKVIVLMTDGNNEWYSWPGGAPDNLGDADVTSYGRLSTNVLGLTAANATTYLNNSMSTMCTAIKSNGITIYTILFNHSAVDTGTISLFQNCASSPQDYFLAPTAQDLQNAFSTIGTELASLRLSQ